MNKHFSIFIGFLCVVASLALLFLVAGCVPTKPTKPINIHCDALCTTPCEPLTAWDGDRDGDRLTALMDAHDVQHQECDQHRQACVACIETARKAGAIK